MDNESRTFRVAGPPSFANEESPYLPTKLKCLSGRSNINSAPVFKLEPKARAEVLPVRSRDLLRVLTPINHENHFRRATVASDMAANV
jgi:hypothetical protein